MPSILKRQRPENRRDRPAKRPKKFKKQKDYHSSSEEEEEEEDEEVQEEPTDFAPVNLNDSEDEDATLAINTAANSLRPQDQAEEEAEDDVDGNDEPDLEADASEQEDDASGSEDVNDEDAVSAASSATRARKKRNDPDVFATSMSKILNSKLSTSKRADPVLSRSRDASLASKELKDQKLETKARHKLREDKRTALEKGRVKDVMGLNMSNISTADIMEQEKRLKKTAQRGVVKLFNAVRAAQVQGEKARDEARKQGVVGLGKREERVNEMSKQGFLELIAGGGKKAKEVEA